MSYAYYPGCSLKGMGRSYEESLLATFRALGLCLDEIDDWNCCGATAYMSVDEDKAIALAARNLAIAEPAGKDLVVPCSACYLVLEKTRKHMREYPDTRKRVCSALEGAGLRYGETARIRHPLEVLFQDVGVEGLKKAVKRPLKGVKVAPYYGCQIVRPFSNFDHQVYPVVMDRLLEACGAEVVYYPLKTRCCGGSLTGTIEEAGQRLAYILLHEAEKRGANVVATLCPLCQFNLDSYHESITRRFGQVSVPTVYFTQLVGYALGCSYEELGLGRHRVPARAALEGAETVAA
ncbi:MAG: CoB--CoM heterodisulfide reductase iron-sulfur subunit B family protein [Verrucomicrobiae bacterium]|nr:CoB--CoM heterodisulfide reductase iron-sulfur subunit B family protein [Verrucomicrobiae bacterium]